MTVGTVLYAYPDIAEAAFLVKAYILYSYFVRTILTQTSGMQSYTACVRWRRLVGSNVVNLLKLRFVLRLVLGGGVVPVCFALSFDTPHFATSALAIGGTVPHAYWEVTAAEERSSLPVALS